jgi:hypothetical protein
MKDQDRADELNLPTGELETRSSGQQQDRDIVDS